MNHNYISLLLIVLLVLLIFTISEILNRYFKLKTELTRKFAHVFAGAVTLSFPALFTNQLFVLLLTVGFFFLLLISRHYRFLGSVNNINRQSYGSLAYPWAIYTCFVFYSFTGKPLYYFLPVTILIISDPLAAYIGLQKKWNPYKIINEVKTFGGSLAFFFSAFLISVICLYMAYPHKNILLPALSIALITTLIEGISIKGLDNIFVPLACVAMLYVLNF